ncbi:hypothetical protein BU16DRAFT_527693 [Lophium mytilinum]|uniref:Tudor domain-containing protein n=1 Tax=Lophium mytilinum TaxID=390894 RepID=A0A6A6QR95_9PEZI|nr:hypothetical protein BU16DRAFT_527693 [Lophium mytilinum]
MARTLDVVQQDVMHQEKSAAELRVMMKQLRDSVKEDPNNIDPGLQDLIDTTQAHLNEDEAKLADLIKELAVLQAKSQEAAEPEKWSREKHPVLGKKAQTPDTTTGEAQITNQFKVNDMVLARWIHGDRGFYKAKITMVMGSVSAPKFRVKFPDFNNDTDEGLELGDLKALDPSKKRKAEETTAPAAAPVKPSIATTVISAPASINMNLVTQARQEPSMVSDGPTKPPKIRRKATGTKALESHKSNWQAFQAKGSKKVKKESMFRTPDLPNARGKRPYLTQNLLLILDLVGVTGSGRPMAKDPTRVRHTYTIENEDDDDY